MDFDFSEDQEAFRKEVRQWLEQNLPESLRGRGFAASRANLEEVAQLRAWQRRMYEAGYVGMDWPREFGGRGAPLVEQIILYQEMARAESPQLVNRGGLSMLGPTLMKYGTPAQRERFLPRILTAEHLWCQGFSEPNAGSDLANLQTRAVREGDVFIVNGQKVWTSMGHVADWCFLLVRTDPQAAKHKGISFLLVDMKTPGNQRAAAAADHRGGGVQRGLLRQRADSPGQFSRHPERGLGGGHPHARVRARPAHPHPSHLAADGGVTADQARSGSRPGP